MEPSPGLSNEERRRRERRIWRRAFGVAVLAHVLLLVLWRADRPLLSPFAAAGPRAGDPRAAGGSMQALNIQLPQPQPITPPLIPLPSIVEPEPLEIEPETRVDVTDILGERPGTGEGRMEGPGREDGQGRGDGGTADEGLFRLVPASPRGMIIPPTHRSLRGREVEVWVFVDERGRVVPDSTRLRPPTSDRDFNRRLLQEAAQWVFEPARRGGQPVASWFPYTISM